ncbi:MAG: acyltransferase [Acidimicrobiia bacterium]|nr:acyltransferase [Acidimicrobiia bacterium]MBT8191801.1 acyltransferase [Acidimicrobiia bacterium]NNJ47192.1 acyltransferase [Acidimicrobiia bacterium]
MKTLTKATEMAQATPSTRNRYIDLLRVFSIFVVVVGHWLMAVITIDGTGAIHGNNILGMVPWLQFLTWGLQVMPIFFIVGGFANSASWTSAQAKGIGYADWVRSRMSRLLRPTLVFAAVWTGLTLLFAHVVRLSPETLEVGTMLVAVPVWFLGVYLLVIPLVPIMLRLHQRFGLVVPLVLVAAAACVDVLVRDLGLVGIGYVNYLFVWVAVHQLGFFWREGRTAGRFRAGLLAALGLASLIVLSSVGLYSRSMLGVPGEEFGNTQPPTSMLMAVGLFQFGIVLALEDPVRRWLERERVWATVISANALAMTVYLWHLPAMAFGVLFAMVSGIGLRGEALTADWWMARPVWVASLALITVPLVMVFSRLERSAGRAAAPGGHAVTAVAGAAAAAVGLGLLALGGFYRSDGLFALAILPLGLLALGAILLGQIDPLRPVRR